MAQGRYWGGKISDECEPQHWWCWRRLTLETFLPTLFCSTELVFFLLLLCWCGGYQHAVEHTAVPKKKGKEGFPPYLCCQQRIMLFFCPGCKPFYCRLDQPTWVFSARPGDFPITHCVDVWVQLFMPAHFNCLAVGNHRLLKGKISPHCSRTIQ